MAQHHVDADPDADPDSDFLLYEDPYPDPSCKKGSNPGESVHIPYILA